MNNKKTIIIVDPDINLIEDLQRRFMLEPDFKIIDISTSGADGFAKIQTKKPDFAVIANPLPDADALQIMNSVTRTLPQVLKIASIEVNNDVLASQCMQAGALHVLVKPYTADDLIEVMKRMELKAPVYRAQDQYQNPSQGFGVGQEPNQTERGSYSQLKEAMKQFANQQEDRGGQSNFSQQGGFSSGFNQGYQGYQGFNQFGQQPYQQQYGYGPGGQFSMPHQQGPVMSPGYDQATPGMGGGFPPPQMGQMGQTGGVFAPQQDGMQGPSYGMETSGSQQGGFRTLKQTVIAVNCPKGGVGKTTISKELAIAYSSVKVAGQPLKVCLVDCDLDFGDVASMLNLQPYPNIHHWISDIRQRLRENPRGEIRYTQQQIEKYLIAHPTGLKILAAPTNHSEALDISEKEIEIVIDNLKACDFDVIILDTGNNTKDYTIVSLDKAHIVLMVVTLDLTTINDTTLLLNTLKSIQFPISKINLVINKMPKRDKDIDVSEISQVLGAPIIGIVPEYPRIRQLNNNGTPAMLVKDTEFSQAIRKIGNKIIPVFNRAIPPQGGAGGKGGGLFSNLFRKR